VDAKLIEELIEQHKSFRIETAARRVSAARHRDFVAFSSRKTSLITNYSADGDEHFAIVPPLIITSAMAWS